MHRIAPTGTLTSCTTPPKRPMNSTFSLPSARAFAASMLRLRTILPSCTNEVGTATPGCVASTITCGVCALSTIHSCIARSRYGRWDLRAGASDMALASDRARVFAHVLDLPDLEHHLAVALQTV